MLNEFHSYDAISKEIENKESLYYLILSDENIVGYAGIRLEKRVLFLSKLYILSSERGKGIGKSSIQFIIQIARSKHINLIYLTVNKENKKTIAAYKKIGFIITSEICADIGRGYYMDDYKMELEL